MTNRFYNESFTASVGQRAQGSSLDTQYSRIEDGFDAVADELDAIRNPGIVTGLEGFPASFADAALKYLRVNAAESAVEFVSGGRLNIKSIGGTGYTLVAADAGYLIITTSADPVTITVPPDVMTQGDVVCIRQGGAGQVTLAPGAGVTLNSSGALLATRTQHAQIAVVADGSNGFGVIGDRNAPSLTLYVDYQLSCSDLTSALSTGTNKAYFRIPRSIQNLSVRASLLTASSSGVVTVDLNRNGSTILSTKLTIDQGEKTSTTAATPAVLTTSTLTDDDEITIDIDGAGTGAVGLIVTLRGELA